jgi:hypothetical protein
VQPERLLQGKAVVQQMPVIVLMMITVLPGSANNRPLAQTKTATRRLPLLTLL